MPSGLAHFLVWNHSLFVIEAILVAASVAIRWRALRAEQLFKKIARHRFAPLAAGIFAMTLRALVLPVEPIPVPTVHDEFSYLLAADTFAHARLANPTHPMWEHFETFHEDQFPTYASMHPPLQGLVLAAGQVLTGKPFFGVWLSVGVMCAALCWALRGWFPAEWAFLAAAIAAMRVAPFSYWGDSYWGGTVAAAGGALLFGALPRIVQSNRRRDALFAALGAVILANTRPYEGLVFSVAIGAVALWHGRKVRWRTVLPAFCLVLLAAGALMAYYNWRVFGSPTTLPYMVNRRTYATAPVFLFQSPRPPVLYRFAEMREFYNQWELAVYESARSWRGYLTNTIQKLYKSWSFYIGPVLTLPFLVFFTTARSRRSRILLFLGAAMLLATSVVPFFFAHYIAAATVVFYAALIQGMRAMNRRVPQMVRAIPAICMVMIGIRIALAAGSIPPGTSVTMTWARNSRLFLDRQAVASRLLENGPRHLVIVHYGAGHDVHAEYVYNAADIDSSPIVWARDMGPAKNSEIVEYFRQRQIWRLDVDSDVVLSPYKGD